MAKRDLTPREGSADPHDPAAVRSEIAKVVEGVIPRLLRNARTQEASPVRVHRSEPLPTEGEVRRIAHLAVAQDLATLLDEVARAHRAGFSMTWVLVDLIPAAARHLGLAWERDERSFADVSMGLGTLQCLLRRISAPEPGQRHEGLVVVTCHPLEQHTLSVYVLGELLAREGWPVHAEPQLTEGQLVRLVSTEPVRAVGFSISHDDLLGAIPAAIARIREASRRADLAILLGGAADALPVVAERYGAIHCPSAREALDWLART